MAINTTLRKITLIADNPFGVTLDDILEMSSVYHGTVALRAQWLADIEEHSPTLAVEAIAWYQLGPDHEATITEIPTVKLPIDPEAIELDPLPASEWTRTRQTHYARYNRFDIL